MHVDNFWLKLQPKVAPPHQKSCLRPWLVAGRCCCCLWLSYRTISPNYPRSSPMTTRICLPYDFHTNGWFRVNAHTLSLTLFYTVVDCVYVTYSLMACTHAPMHSGLHRCKSTSYSRYCASSLLYNSEPDFCPGSVVKLAVNTSSSKAAALVRDAISWQDVWPVPRIIGSVPTNYFMTHWRSAGKTWHAIGGCILCYNFVTIAAILSRS